MLILSSSGHVKYFLKIKSFFFFSFEKIEKKNLGCCDIGDHPPLCFSALEATCLVS